MGKCVVVRERQTERNVYELIENSVRVTNCLTIDHHLAVWGTTP